ncbi:MAG: hypothetical protein JW939_03665 [Candidatus Thermoplasmatota archaeon]|nr:hypothetical protein [Candidatus Thermoplasmatota archaeon]
MIDQDMLFRAGLILSVLVLSGLFGASLAGRMEQEPLERMKEISHEFGLLITTLHLRGPGSSMKIAFGDAGTDDDACVVMPSFVNDEYFDIELRPGAVSIRRGEHLLMAATGPWIIPSLPPMSTGVLNGSIYRRISLMSGGFTVRTPVVLRMCVPPMCSDGIVCIYPEEIGKLPLPSGVAELDLLLNEPGEVIPGWRDEASLGCDDIIVLDPPLVILKREDSVLSSGTCPLPVHIPWETLPSLSMGHVMRGHITFFREASLLPDGNITFISGFEFRT